MTLTDSAGLTPSIGLGGIDVVSPLPEILNPIVLAPFTSGVAVGLKPGIVNIVPVSKKEFTGADPWVSVSGFHVKIDGCVGESFIRKFPGHDKTGNVYLRVAGWHIMEENLGRAAELLDEAEKSLPDSELMPAFLYWHADCIFKTSRSSRSKEYQKGRMMLERITYDYPESKWAKYAAARLVEVGGGR